MTLRMRSLAALGVILGCAALVVGLLGAEGVLQAIHGHAGENSGAFFIRILAEFASVALLLVLALVCLYVAARSPRGPQPSEVHARNHHAVTL